MTGSWSTEPIFGSYLGVVLATLALLALLLVGPRFGGITNRRQLILVTLRIGLVLLLLLAMLQPSYVFTDSQPQTAVILILFDESLSMDQLGTTGEGTRWEDQVKLLRSIEPILKDFDKNLKIKVYGYDTELHPRGGESGKLEIPAAATGRETDIGGTLYEALQQNLGERIACVILLGDGTQTAFAPRIEIHQAGRELERLGVALYTVPFGQQGNVQQAKDLALEQLPQQYTVFVKNQLTVRALVHARGYVNQQLPVTVRVIDEQDQQVFQRTVQVLAREDDQLVPIEIDYVPQQTGRYLLSCKVAEQPGELLVENNELTAYLTVLEGGIKVLYLYGSRLGEQLELRHTIASSPDMELVEQLVSMQSRTNWPDRRTHLLADEQFDVIILENLNAQAVSGDDLAALEQLVGKGKGFLMIGGYHSFGPGGYGGTPVETILPIQIDPIERQALGATATVQSAFHLSGQLPMVPTRPHPITRLATETENRARWQSLPPLNGANRFSRIKANGRVLLESSGPEKHPLLVSSEYGAGRTVAFAGDSTWQWKRAGFEQEQRQFWRQLILWLVHREDVVRRDVWVQLTQRRYLPGTPLTFKTGIRSTGGESLTAAKLEVRWIDPAGDSHSTRIVPHEDHWQGTIEDLREPGSYRIEVRAVADGQELGKARADFHVMDQQAEKSNPRADIEQLNWLAQFTQEQGGKLVAPEQVPALIKALRDQPPELKIEMETKWQLGGSALDAWLFFLGIVALLSSEWFLRKRWGLV
jgi:uncharacterized membrane protein